MSETVETLKEEVKELTKICCALHKRLGGGRVILPVRDYSGFDGSEEVLFNAYQGGKGYTVEVKRT